MKNVLSIFTLVALVAFTACNTSQSTDQQQEKDGAAKEETTEKAEKTESKEASTAKAQKEAAKNEQVITASFLGLDFKDNQSFYVYQDQQGEEYWFKEGGFPYLYVMVNAGQPAPVFATKNFKIHYTDEDALAIESIEEIDVAGKTFTPTPALSMDDLSNAVFFGATESNWSLAFKPEEMVFTPNIGEDPKNLMYQTGGGKHPKIHAVNDNQVRVRASGRGYEYLFVIKKQDCSDGMSENTYPYAITLYRQGMEGPWEKWQRGCGRVKN